MKIFRSCVLGCVLWGAVSAQSGSAPDIWAPVRFLAGSWEGEVNGQPGTGRSQREYRFVLNDRYLEVRNKSSYAAQPKNPKGEVHEDWGMISYDRSRKRLVLRQFHVEGFVNQYAAEPVSDGPLTFQSEAIENIPAGYRAREIYRAMGPNEFVERFEIAEPGKNFEVYSETRFRRRN
jgi:hypothetical protein